MTARLRPLAPPPATSPWAPAQPSADALPPLSQILAHYRRHGTLAGSIARADDAAPTPAVAAPVVFREAIDGLQTRELDGAALFDHYFGAGR